MFLDQIQSVDEAYIGKQPNLLAMENALIALERSITKIRCLRSSFAEEC